MTGRTERLFVYGTLMPGSIRHGVIERYVRSAQPATVPGILVDLGPFPALIPGDGHVQGVLLEVDPEAVEITDRLEGHAVDPRSALYQREAVMVTLENGEIVTAWTYEFANPDHIEHHPKCPIENVEGKQIQFWKSLR